MAETKKAQVKEGMSYRVGDGPQVPIPPGPCEIVVTPQDATISWRDGEARGVAAIPITEYRQRVKEGLLVLR
jgi:hypothetical protein